MHLKELMDIDSRLYVEIHPFEGPFQPHPHPVRHGNFNPDYVYKVIGMYNASETSEAYLVLVNPERQLWFIPNRHVLAYRLIDSDEFFLPKAVAADAPPAGPTPKMPGHSPGRPSF